MFSVVGGFYCFKAVWCDKLELVVGTFAILDSAFIFIVICCILCGNALCFQAVKD